MYRYLLIIIIYSYINAQWMRQADFPGTLLRSANEISLDDKGFIFGGIKYNGQFSNHVWMYNSIDNYWIQKSDLPEYLTDTYIYNMPKFFNTSNHIYGMRNNNIYQYDHENDNWILINSSYPGSYSALMPQTIFTDNEHAYIGYGWYNSGTTYYPSATENEELYKYNYILDSWEEIIGNDLFKLSNSNKFTFDGDNVFIWNGWWNQSDTTKIYRYNTYDYSLELITVVPFSLNGYLDYSDFIFFQNNIHILGGMDELYDGWYADTTHFIYSLIDDIWYHGQPALSSNLDYLGRANPVTFVFDNSIFCGLGMGSWNYDNLYNLHDDLWSLNNHDLIGDLNNDGLVNISDALLLVTHVLGYSYLPDDVLIKSDIDYNEKIDIFDVLLITDISTN